MNFFLHLTDVGNDFQREAHKSVGDVDGKEASQKLSMSCRTSFVVLINYRLIYGLLVESNQTLWSAKESLTYEKEKLRKFIFITTRKQFWMILKLFVAAHHLVVFSNLFFYANAKQNTNENKNESILEPINLMNVIFFM